jgi:AcrR family transcriptional regulator
MDDIAAEVGLLRPNVYRYFADRDDLLLELITRRTRALLDRARKFASRRSSLPDQLVESVLYTADNGRRDPLTRHIIDPAGTSLGRRMIASGTSETIRAEMWDPLLDAALANNELPPGLDGGAAGVLDGVRVVELADERAEYIGLLLAGMGAEVWVVDGDHGKACVDVASHALTLTRVTDTIIRRRLHTLARTAGRTWCFRPRRADRIRCVGRRCGLHAARRADHRT